MFCHVCPNPAQLENNSRASGIVTQADVKVFIVALARLIKVRGLEKSMVK